MEQEEKRTNNQQQQSKEIPPHNCKRNLRIISQTCLPVRQVHFIILLSLKQRNAQSVERSLRNQTRMVLLVTDSHNKIIYKIIEHQKQNS
ncbi:MAG: hypothetical protein ACYDA4_11970 [Ignavibacteriaceae bacterium]